MPSNWQWTDAYTHRLIGNIHGVSSSIVCLPEKDAGGHGPKMESWAFALTTTGSTLSIMILYFCWYYSCRYYSCWYYSCWWWVSPWTVYRQFAYSTPWLFELAFFLQNSLSYSRFSLTERDSGMQSTISIPGKLPPYKDSLSNICHLTRLHCSLKEHNRSSAWNRPRRILLLIFDEATLCTSRVFLLSEHKLHVLWSKFFEPCRWLCERHRLIPQDLNSSESCPVKLQYQVLKS